MNRAEPAALPRVAARAERARIEERLVDAGRILGVRVSVSDGTDWAATPEGMRVGLGFFLDRGHPPEEAGALALRELWATVRWARLAPERLFRRRAIERARPELAALLLSIDRAQAGTEVRAAMPGALVGLRDATERSIPQDLSDWPVAAQWLGLLLRSSLGLGTRVAPPVRAEARGLARAGATSADVLGRVLGPAPGGSAVDRLDRALAVLAPPALRLAALTAAGLGDPGDAAGAAAAGDALGLGLGDPSAGEPGAEPGAADGGEYGDAPDPAQHADDAADAAPDDEGDEDDERRPGAEHLGESAGSALPAVLLDTPLPASHASLDPDRAPEPNREHGARAEGDEDAGGDSRAAPTGGPPGPPGLSKGSAAAALAEYRRRLGGYRAEIEGTREAWRRVLGNAAEDRLVPGRAASAEGETLHTGRLAATVTEVSAGRTRPDAFRVRARVSRSARAPGHTDYALVLDRSASMRGRNAQLCGDAAMVMVEALEAVSRDVAQAAVRPRAALAPQLRAALIVFDAAPVTVKPLARPLDEAARAGLHAAVRGAGGSTLGAPALREAARELGLVTAASRPTPAAPGDPRRIVILVSDGGVTDAAELRGEASALRRAGADVVGIGVGAGAGLAELGIEARRIERLDQLPGALAGLLAEHAHPSPRGAASGGRA